MDVENIVALVHKRDALEQQRHEFTAGIDQEIAAIDAELVGLIGTNGNGRKAKPAAPSPPRALKASKREAKPTAAPAATRVRLIDRVVTLLGKERTAMRIDAIAEALGGTTAGSVEFALNAAAKRGEFVMRTAPRTFALLNGKPSKSPGTATAAKPPAKPSTGGQADVETPPGAAAKGHALWQLSDETYQCKRCERKSAMKADFSAFVCVPSGD